MFVSKVSVMFYNYTLAIVNEPDLVILKLCSAKYWNSEIDFLKFAYIVMITGLKAVL
jgi:hypothetical protein